jgi:uncharacterized membrane protein
MRISPPSNPIHPDFLVVFAASIAAALFFSLLYIFQRFGSALLGLSWL